MPKKRPGRISYGHRRAYYGTSCDGGCYRPSYNGHYNAGYYVDGYGYGYGCNTVYIPYGWTWYRASSC